MDIAQSRSIRQNRLLLIFIILTLVFIWGNSILPAEQSSKLSDFVKSVLHIDSGQSAKAQQESTHLVRKIAHALEFAMLGTVLSLLWRRQLQQKWSLLLLSGVGTALIDETIQLFSSGRSSEVRDVWVDLMGFCAGCLIVCLCLYVYRRTNNRMPA